MVCTVLAAFAQRAAADNLIISGFGTGALTRTDSNDVEFVRPNQASGATRTARTGVDSNFGLQGYGKIDDSWSFTVQGLVRKEATDYYGAILEWAFVKLKASDELSLRLGRIGAPIYMISDFRNVGYANTMMRSPAEVYQQVPVTSYDGADVLWRHSYANDMVVSANFGVGVANTPMAGNFTVRFKPLTSLNVMLEHGPLSLRLGRADAMFSARDNTQLEGLLQTLDTLGFAKVAEQIPVKNVRGSFTSLGLGLDWQHLLVQAEYAVRKTGTRLYSDTSSWYAMLGYRHGEFTPYGSYANVHQQSLDHFAALPSAGPMAPLTTIVNALAKAPLQSSAAIGMRWDFTHSAALKLQMDHIMPRSGIGAGDLVNARPGFFGPVNVYAAGIDFVF